MPTAETTLQVQLDPSKLHWERKNLIFYGHKRALFGAKKRPQISPLKAVNISHPSIFCAAYQH